MTTWTLIVIAVVRSASNSGDMISTLKVDDFATFAECKAAGGQVEYDSTSLYRTNVSTTCVKKTRKK